MLKLAYELGYQEAIKEAAMTPAQMQAAQIASGVGGGLLGAGAGSLLGKYLSDHGEYNPKLTAGIGALLGGGAGALIGSQLPRALIRTEPAPRAPEESVPNPVDQRLSPEESVPNPVDQRLSPDVTPVDESALGVLPAAYQSYDPYTEALYQQVMSQGAGGGYY